jgi:NarL family two-component system sensor histidine kinase LiaS
LLSPESISICDPRSFPFRYAKSSDIAVSIYAEGRLSMVTDNQLAAEIQDAIELERSRIACDLHDGVTQQLVLALLKLEYLQHLLDVDQHQGQLLQLALEEVHKTSAIIKASLAELRHCISSSLPLQLTRYGFSVALQNLLEEYRDEGLQISYQCDELTSIQAQLEVCIYRFLQEALNNICKHAHATQVAIHFYSSADTLIIEVQDNGCGLSCALEKPTGSICSDSSQNGQGNGLQIMRERIQNMGGTWQLRSQVGQGTTIQVRFPLSR